jgi:hypothetical protein
MARHGEPIKICLTNQGRDTETPWAEDLGPARGHAAGSRKARLINVPFLHAKPTWGDVIVVSPVEDGLPTWDRDGVPWAQIGTRIADDSGRWAMIVDYAPHRDAKEAFGALAVACAEQDVVCEGAWGPRGDGAPGRAYLAVKDELSDVELMRRLFAASLPCDLVQIHPAPVIQDSTKRAATVKSATDSKSGGPAAKPTKQPAAKPTKQAATKPTKQAAAKPTKQAATKPTKQAATKPTKQPGAPPPAARPTKKSAKPPTKKPARR